MLVICNGAYKSGSTWLFNIVGQLSDFRFPPNSYQNPGWRNPSIDPDRLADFIASVDFTTEDYISKQHIVDLDQRDFLLMTEHLFVLDIARDIRDVVVSAYYHHRREGRFVGSFDDFYQIEGRLIAHQVGRYHEVWRGQSDKVLVVSYEALHADFGAEVGRIAAFLGLPASAALVERVRHENSIDRLRAKYGETGQPADQRFFRKGVVGGWQEHLSPALAEELRAIEANGLARRQRLECRVRTKLHRALRAYPNRVLGQARNRLHGRA